MTDNFWKDRPVLVTGHTGFKGSWLCLWLQSLGARVFGVALPPVGSRNLYEIASVGDGMTSSILDLRDFESLLALIGKIQPECVFHLAAQPLVRLSYEDPVGTFSTNILGTVHVLEAIRRMDCIRSAVIVTSDKCYENREWERGYRESDAMGGSDPYSASKGCAELVTAAYIRSYFHNPGSPGIATARAGNVIGGGDWAADRLVPDLLSALAGGRTVRLRHPGAIRPWQHVLDPLAGYLRLAEQLAKGLHKSEGGWNFGPAEEDVRTVAEVVRLLANQWGADVRIEVETSPQPHEAGLLKLDCSKAGSRLGWTPTLRLDAALQWTVNWHKAWIQGGDMASVTAEQIASYLRLTPSPGGISA